MGDMPPEHEAHRSPRPRELIAIIPEGHRWAVTTVPIEYLSPMQARGLYFDRDTGWWCAPLP